MQSLYVSWYLFLCACVTEWWSHSADGQVSLPYLSTSGTGVTVAVTLSEVLNLRQQSAARKLFKTLVTIHVSINNGGYDTAFPVPDKQNPSLCLLSTEP